MVRRSGAEIEYVEELGASYDEIRKLYGKKMRDIRECYNAADTDMFINRDGIITRSNMYSKCEGEQLPNNSVFFPQ